MTIGALRQRVQLQQKTVTRDSFGAETETWVTKKTVWASVEPLAGQEYFIGKMENAEVSHKIVIRYYSGLTPDWRIEFGTRVFNIFRIFNVDFESTYMEIMATEQIRLGTVDYPGGFILDEFGGGRIILFEDIGKVVVE